MEKTEFGHQVGIADTCEVPAWHSSEAGRREPGGIAQDVEGVRPGSIKRTQQSAKTPN